MRVSVKSISLIAVMGALGNVIGLIEIPLAPGVLLHLSQFTGILIAINLGPLAGGITGALSVLFVTFSIGTFASMFIPLGNFILSFAAGLASKRFRPLIAGLIGEVVETPYLWLTTILILPIPLITLINVKAFIEVAISSLVVEALMARAEVKRFFEAIK
ncbi:MAG: hypothetical protein ACE5GD_11385 [Candidatus Geothermarchaeales archaeon]